MNLLDTLKEAAWQCAENKPLLASSILRAAIAELGKAEPVAWMYRSEDPFDAGDWLLTDTKPDRREVVALYTHPAPAVPEEQWITELRYELMKSKMTHNFTFSRNEVIALLNAAPKGETL